MHNRPNYLKDFVIEDSTINRVDVHWFGYNLTARDCRIINTGVRSTGGGALRLIRPTWVLTARADLSGDAGDAQTTTFFSPRADFGSDFDGEVYIEDLTIEIGAGYTGSTIVLVRCEPQEASGVPYDPGRDTSLPQRIIFACSLRIIAPAAIGASAEFNVIGVYLATTSAFGRKIYYPHEISFPTVGWLNENADQKLTFTPLTSFQFAHESVYVKGRAADTVARHGTNCNVTIKGVTSILKSPLAAADEGLLINLAQNVGTRAARYSDADAWHPRISIEDCDRAIITNTADGKLLIDKSTLQRLKIGLGGTPTQRIRVTNSDIKPLDSDAVSGSAAFTFPTGSRVSYNGCDFYIPLDDNGSFVSAVSLASVKGGLNTLQDGAISDTHYSNVPASFFQ